MRACSCTRRDSGWWPRAWSTCSRTLPTSNRSPSSIEGKKGIRETAMIVTPIYAGILAILFFILSMRVIVGRGKNGPSLGDGGDVRMQRRIRGHGNFAEYVPLILVMMAMLELSHYS